MSSPSRRAWRANFTSRERRLDTRTRQVLGGCTGVKKCPPPPKKKKHTVPLRTIRHKTDHISKSGL